MSDEALASTRPTLEIESPDEYLPTEWVPIDAIEPNEWNPNVMEDEERKMLIRSIKNHGWTRPIVVHSEEEYIIDGEQRWQTVQQAWHIDGTKYDPREDESLTPPDVPAGYVPVFGISVTEDEARVSTLQHNRARGFVDYNSLYDYLEEFHQTGLLDDLSDELDLGEDDMLRIVEDESVAQAVGADVELSDPWEPRDIREFDSADLSSGASRTTSMEESDSDESIQRVSAVLTETEREKVVGVFTEENMANNVVNALMFIEENDLIPAFRDMTGIEEHEDYPHPDDIDE